MSEQLRIEIHCSQLARWSSCEKAQLQAFFAPNLKEDTGEHIATWMGSAVHARIAEEEQPPFPESLRYDEITPTWQMAALQVEMMVESVQMALEVECWTILEQETELEPYRDTDWLPELYLVGRKDLYAMDVNCCRVVADIKTARDFRPAWIQTGGYALCAMAAGYKVHKVAAVHAPRPNIMNPVEPAQVYERPVRPVITETLRLMERISELIEEEDRAVAAPGDRCKWCQHPHCFVRSMEQAQR